MNSEAVKLLDEAVGDAREYLPRLRGGLQEVVLMLQEGREGEGINLFVECIEGLEWFASVMDGSAFLGGEFANSGMELADRYRQVLTDMVEGWENNDMVLIGDLLEFEIIPLIDEFLERIN